MGISLDFSMISHGNEWECTGSIMQIPTTYIELRP
jgi:hypothetical protein